MKLSHSVLRPYTHLGMPGYGSIFTAFWANFVIQRAPKIMKIDSDSLFAMLFLIPYLYFLLLNPVTADPLFTVCSTDVNNYTLDSPFENNLKRLLMTLPSNASRTGFFETSMGDGRNRVYGNALCRGDVTSTVCQDCVEGASQEIVKECKSNEAIIWYELCQVRYSFQNTTFLMVYTGKFPQQNYEEKNVTDDPVRFNAVLMGLMKNLSHEAAFDPSNERMFATGEVDSSSAHTIYGLVQCTRDISRTYCGECLGYALTELAACCNYRRGGMVVSRNCNVRFELYRFYHSTAKGEGWKIWVIVVVACILTLTVAILVGSSVLYLWRKKGKKNDEERSQHALMHELGNNIGVSITQEGNLMSSEELPFIDFATIQAATDNFSDSNKLGRGGFGTVYKGVLPNGKEIAAKRLSRKSWQGLGEFKNEIEMIAKLQHRNLVRLLGCSIEGEERLLIYEFMPNKSLDVFIFDSAKRAQLDWMTCHNIICGIARGLLYLHEDSRFKIIHRDLKPNNVLLDHEMVAKISDFGMARIFCENQNTANTRKVVGTYGYMAPEYAMEGLFSVKSDVFSFGVILFEVISGKRNSRFYLTANAQTLIAYVWKLWNEGKELEFVDPSITESCPTAEVLRCIHIGLLCVQEDPTDRPTMSTVVVLLGSESIALPEPRQPAFSVGRVIQNEHQSSTTNRSVNFVTVSTIAAR